MNIYVPLGLILIFISFLARKNTKASQRVFLLCFLAMFVFASIRYEFGPDYETYCDNHGVLKSSGLESFLSSNQHSEKGFVVFLSMFDSFFVFIIVQSLVWLGVFYYFFKNNVEEKYYYVIILMMFFNVNFNLLNYTAIRSSLAGCLFFLGLGFLISNEDIGFLGSSVNRLGLTKHSSLRLVLYFILVFIGSLFHTSMLFFMVFPFITTTNNISKSASLVLLIIGVVLSVVSVVLRSTFTLALSWWVIDLAPSSFDRYTDYLDMVNTAAGGLGALLFNIMKVVIAYPILQALVVEKDKRYIRLMQFAIIFLYLFLLINENLLSRFTMCFYPVIVVALLRSFRYSTNDIRFISLFSIIALSVFQFYVNINTPSYMPFLEYHTIFSAPYWL